MVNASVSSSGRLAVLAGGSFFPSGVDCSCGTVYPTEDVFAVLDDVVGGAEPDDGTWPAGVECTATNERIQRHLQCTISNVQFHMYNFKCTISKHGVAYMTGIKS